MTRLAWLFDAFYALPMAMEGTGDYSEKHYIHRLTWWLRDAGWSDFGVYQLTDAGFGALLFISFALALFLSTLSYLFMRRQGFAIISGTIVTWFSGVSGALYYRAHLVVPSRTEAAHLIAVYLFSALFMLNLLNFFRSLVLGKRLADLPEGMEIPKKLDMRVEDIVSREWRRAKVN